MHFFDFFGAWKKLPGMARQDDFVPTNPDLAHILGRMDFNFELFILLIFWIPNFWISRFQKSGFPQNLDFPASQNLDFPASKKSARRPGGGRTDGRTADGVDGGRTADGRRRTDGGRTAADGRQTDGRD